MNISVYIGYILCTFAKSIHNTRLYTLLGTRSAAVVLYYSGHTGTPLR